MGVVNVTRITATPAKAVEVVDENTIDVLALLTRAKLSKRWTHTVQQIEMDDGGLGWRITLSPVDGGESFIVQPTYWIIERGDLELSMMDGPAAVDEFHADVPLKWRNTTAAPDVTASVDGTATITVKQPTSINGPWSYGVDLTEHGGETTELTPEPRKSILRSPGPNVEGLIIGAAIELDLTGLTPGEYTAVVHVACTDYAHEAESLEVVFTVPEPPTPEPEPEPEPEPQPQEPTDE